MNCSLFQNFKKNHFIEKPFPHLVIENALPNEVCERLTENYPKKKFQEMNDFKLSAMFFANNFIYHFQLSF